MRFFLTALSLFLAVSAHAAEPKRIALTFDDVPRTSGAFFDDEERTMRLLRQLEVARVEQAAFFVNPGRIADRPGSEDRIARYVAAGHVIANHTATHPRLQAVEVDAFFADVDTAEAWLRGREGRRPWMRYPYLDEGGPRLEKRDAARAELVKRKLLKAWVTVDASDWHTEAAVRDAVAAGRRIDFDKLGRFYVERHVASAQFADDLARRTIGRSPPHVMLLHETDIAALYVADLVAALRAAGWEIVAADEAYADPVYREQPETEFATGTLFEQLAWAKGIEGQRWWEGNRNDLLDERFEAAMFGEDGAKQ